MLNGHAHHKASRGRPAASGGRVTPRQLAGSAFFGWLLLAASSAWADVGPPVKIRLPATVEPAFSGQPYAGEVQVLVGRAGTVEDIQVSGEGWAITAIAPSGSLQVAAGQVLTISFEGTPADSTQRLKVSLTFDGRRTTQSFNLSPQRFAEIGMDAPSTVAPGSAFSDAPMPGVRVPRTEGEGQALHITGRIVYTRPDGLKVGVDSVWFEIVDDDSPDFDETMYSGLTDENGYFDVHLNWDDCDILGCDDPDIYIRYETDNGVVNVQRDDLLEEDYSWSTEDDPWDDFGGSFIGFGELSPADPGQFPALHIHNSVVRAWRFIKEHTGIEVKEFDAGWPADEEDGTRYSPTYEEMYITPSQQWIEGTIIHEYGHHFMHLYSSSPEPDYCNGFCSDTADKCNHCVWCMEKDSAHWTEGWPNWLGWAVMTSYPPGEVPLSINDGRYTGETPMNCGQDGQRHDPRLTEGFVLATLRDLADANPVLDNHMVTPPPPPDCSLDATALGFDEIMAIVVQDKPTSLVAFIAAFRNRYSEHDMDLWSTLGNIGPELAFPTPVPQVSIEGPDCGSLRAGQPIVLKAKGNGSLLRYQWRRNGVNLADGGPISGATGPTLTIDPAEPGHGGSYNCLATTCDGTLTWPSTHIRVHVFPAPGAGSFGAGWGRNDLGQVGSGSYCNSAALCSTMPQHVDHPAEFTSVSANEWHSLGLHGDGTVWSWGSSSYYDTLGLGPAFPTTPTPRKIPDLQDIVQVATGELHSLALAADGRVWAWGYSGFGQLGRADYGYERKPVENLKCVVAVAAGDYHSVALGSDGTVWTWGANYHGELGAARETTGAWTHILHRVEGVSDVTSIAAGAHWTLALKSDGTVWAWGRNSEGQLGQGDATDRHAPVQVPGLSGVTAISAGPFTALALLADGTVRGWGNNGGALGDGTHDRRFSPVQAVGLTGVRQVSAGYYHSLFLKADGTLWISGWNTVGQLGMRTGVLLVPTRLATVNQVRSVATGGAHNIVLMAGLPPRIHREPVDTSAFHGAQASLSLAAEGPGALSYRWFHKDQPVVDGPEISGATTPTLSFKFATSAHAGAYRAEVSNDFGTIPSVSVTLSVACAPVDYNCDGDVGLEDRQAFELCTTGPRIAVIPPGCTYQQFHAADLDDDNDVDQEDFGLFQRCYVGDGKPPAPGCLKP